MKKNKTNKELLIEVENLKVQLAEAEDTLRAIRSGEVDALVVSGEQGEQVFTLKGAEQPYRILIEEMSEGAVMLAADDSILYCNSGFAGMLKKPLEKLIGTGISHYIAPADKALFLELLRRGKEKSSTGEIILLAGDGTFIPAQLSFNTLQTDDARLAYLVATDLTGQKKIQEELQKARDELEIRVEERTEELRESEQLWSTTLSSIGDAVISTDDEGRINFMNAEAQALTGWTLAEASTKPVPEVFNIINGHTRREADNPVCRVLNEGKVIGLANNTILVRKDGTEVPIDDSGAPIRDADGKTIGVVLVFRDITERKQAEDAIIRHNAIQEGFNRILSAALTCDTEEELGRTCLEVAERITQSKFGFIGEINKKGLEDIAISNPGWDACEIVGEDGHHQPIGSFAIHGIYGRVILEGKSLFSNDPAHHPDHIGIPPGHPPLDSFLGVPLIRQANTIGMIAVGNREGGYNHDQQEALDALAPAIVEAFQRKRAEVNLRESEARFRSVLDNSRDVIYRMNAQTGRFEYISPSAKIVVGFSPDELMALDAKNALAMIHPEDLPAMRRVFAHLEDTGKAELEYRQLAKNGDYRWISNHMSLIKDAAGRPLFRNGNIRDITEHKRAEEELNKSRKQFQSILDNTPSIVFIKDMDGKYILFNRQWEKLFNPKGINMEDLTDFEIFPPKLAEKLHANDMLVINSRTSIDFEESVHLSDRTLHIYLSTKSPIFDDSGKIFAICGISTDITGRKRAEEVLQKANDELELRVNDRTAQLKESLNEKEILLREVHHRVKNNMQVISGLLMLQEEFSNDKKVSEMIKESQNRIASMALIHEKLYRSESLSKIDLKEYLDDLISGLFESYGVAEEKVRLKVQAENISLGIETAIPCGLIINELVSNCLKHAFPVDKNGEIKISLITTGKDMIELLVRDNGVGIPENVDFRKTESLGLHIVNILVENQLHGEITMTRNKGTEFRIRFREIK